MMPAPELVLIAAVASNGVIGVNNTLPWRLPDDLKRFKALTFGHPVIMGRKTWESLGRPLPGRHNIVITRAAGFVAPGATVAHSVKAALAACGDAGIAFIIGGAEIYAQTLPLAQRLELTEIHAGIEGDAHFPAIDRSVWRETARARHSTDAGLEYDFVSYERLE
jgi:dihydrofolate reductase